MPTLQNVESEESHPLFVMMKGEPGTRKSTQALSFPTPQYWISWDQKMEALIIPRKRWGIKATDIEFDDYKNWNDPRIKLEQLQVNCKYKTIVVDSITSGGDATTSQVKKTKKSGGDKGKEIGGIPISGFEEFNAESAAFQEMIALLKDIHKFHKVNIILIAHVIGTRKDNDANKLTHHARIIVTGAEKISAKLASYMTEVYHFNIIPNVQEDGPAQYSLYTAHTGNDYARTSLPLEQRIIFNSDPLYDKWIKPAIINLKNEKPIERIPPQTITTPTTNITNPTNKIELRKE